MTFDYSHAKSKTIETYNFRILLTTALAKGDALSVVYVLILILRSLDTLRF